MGLIAGGILISRGWEAACGQGEQPVSLPQVTGVLSLLHVPTVLTAVLFFMRQCHRKAKGVGLRSKAVLTLPLTSATLAPWPASFSEVGIEYLTVGLSRRLNQKYM